ncbi:Uncharacterised protein [Citrobacter freundii]|nr:Uncharacterised protein [Citrobacter freundii]
MDAAGNVSFAGTPSSATKSVTITATPKSGVGPARTYSFTLSYWLLNQGSRGSMTALDSTCSGLGYASVPLNIITDRTSASPTGAARKVGHLWNEWGAMATYGWNTSWAHWSADWVTLNTDRVTVWLLNGNWQSENRTGATYYNWNLCYKGL